MRSERTKVAKTITRHMEIQLVGLLFIARQQRNALAETERAIAAVLGVKPDEYGYYGHVSDSIYEDYPATVLLKKLAITVKGK